MSNSPLIMKLGMEDYVLKLYKVNIDDDPELTMTYFTTMSTLANLSRPRYQVSVKRNVGPLVYFDMVEGSLLKRDHFNRRVQVIFIQGWTSSLNYTIEYET